jgi:hypothetical protein
LNAAGVALFAISYDSVEVLEKFSREHGIGYPLLSDGGSHVMRRLGLLNPTVQQDHAFYGIGPNPRHVDLPYPGVFVLDTHGTVTLKRFHESYRVRDTGGSLVSQVLGDSSAPASAETVDGPDGVRGRAWLDSPTYTWFQRLRLTVEVSIDDGLHVYGQPAPDGSVPLSLEVEPIAGLEVGEVEGPEPHSMRIDGLEGTFSVYEGTIRLAAPLTFTAPPGGGDHILRVTVRYQACSDTACSLPASAHLPVPVREVALVGRALPAKNVG